MLNHPVWWLIDHKLPCVGLFFRGNSTGNQGFAMKYEGFGFFFSLKPIQWLMGMVYNIVDLTWIVIPYICLQNSEDSEDLRGSMASNNWMFSSTTKGHSSVKADKPNKNVLQKVLCPVLLEEMADVWFPVGYSGFSPLASFYAQWLSKQQIVSKKNP